MPQENMVVEAGEVLTEDSDIEIKMLPCRVSGLQRLANNVMGLTLKIPEAAVFHYHAGQYIDILLRDGRRRSYSIANANQDQGLLELHIRHMPGGVFSEHVFTVLKEKDLLRFRGPYGAFVWRHESHRPAILVATGTGFAPIKALLEQAFSEKYKGPLHLYWGNRQQQDFYLLELLNGWQQMYDNFSFTPVLSKPLDSDDWKGRYGWVQDAVLADYPELSAYDVYASGSPEMVASAKAVFTERGLATDHYYSDAFVKAGD
ncbi:MAG: FAD-binding oxidoreductase, partial [Gammaproteobacteria bacterium]|nr:FAD-binding oxidoreductase [Gammaproteobacteria bacterium]